jgi:hypothetical protein
VLAEVKKLDRWETTSMRRILLAVALSYLSVSSVRGQSVVLPAPPLPSQPQAQSLPSAPQQSGQPSPFPARMTIIDPRGVEARSGPTVQYYPTSQLKYGDTVTVIRESKESGWYEIAPPMGSFSWVDGRYLKRVDKYTGYIDVEGNGQAPVMPGSSLINKEPNVESSRIASGFQVLVLEEPMDVNGRKWFRIAPPGNDVRFIPKEAVQPPQAASVAPTNWQRNNTSTPPSQPAWTPPGQLVNNQNQNNGTVGTPASFSQPAQQGSQYNTPAAQPPQWSQWGKLRGTAFTSEKDGQRMFVLEDRQGRSIMYVTSTAGTSLDSYREKTVCLYGAISYRSDGYQRTYYMVASHVATP